MKFTMFIFALLMATVVAAVPPTLSLKNQFGEVSNNWIIGGNSPIGSAAAANSILSNLTGSAAYPLANSYSSVSALLLPTMLLTGWTSGPGLVAGTDSVIQGMQKIDGNVNRGASLLSSTTTLTASQVNALNVTPIQLIAAVSNKVIQVVSCKLVYTKGSAAFTVGTGSDKLVVQYHTAAIAVASVLETGFIDQATAQTADIFGSGAGGNAIRGMAVEASSNSADTTVGTGSTVAVFCLYNVI